MADMAGGHNPDPSSRHEEKDTNIRAVLWFAAGLIATIVVVLVLMKWTFNAFPTPESQSSLPPYAQGVATELPPEPRLQVHAPEDLKKMREQEDSVLSSYGWVDRQNGVVRIPIRRAMELLIQRSGRPQTVNSSKPADK